MRFVALDVGTRVIYDLSGENVDRNYANPELVGKKGKVIRVITSLYREIRFDSEGYPRECINPAEISIHHLKEIYEDLTE